MSGRDELVVGTLNLWGRWADWPARLEALTAWIDRYRLVREEQFRRLDAVLDTRAADRGEHTQD